MEYIDKELIPAEHEEEILVLRSIFNEDFVSNDNVDHQSTFNLIVRFDSLPEKILLIHNKSNASTEVSHLPPITLHITYKNTYPKIDPPLYCIECDYLTCDQLSSLANKMDKMWISGDVIVYTWIELLKDYFFNLNNQFILFDINSSTDDKRFRTNYDKIGSKQIYDQLVEYNRVQNQSEFERTIHICPICLDEKSGRSCLKFEKCHHYACLSCLNSYAIQLLSRIQENKAINCYECDSPLFLTELRRIFSDDKLLLKYQKHLLEQTTDMVWCPRCHHSIICVPPESTSGNHRSFAECVHCQFIFCRRCQQSWHPQVQCPKDAMIQDIQQNPNADKDKLKLNRIELSKILLELDNIQIIEQCTKPCPSCQVRIEKNGGCQHMNCRHCQIHFCWLCGWYGRAYGPHPCNVKPEKQQASLPSEMNEKLEQIFHDENGKQIIHAVVKRIQMCPRENCRQTHIKVGANNLLKCEKCGNDFCFLCGEAVYGKFHFSEYGCKITTQL
ncbi:unnamed protein product [Rotaria socialis]|uniref:RBR-type E3 ubiquitin transferase n=1 Tax=Rotaria socialis TaxID=392032 RepID=A0A817UY68_9BILA|nr:unnamed protein product [Rotaria socialis]CAF3338053.1 unnamed protein product [Rotaria socialis]CAF4195493.1 unnamed protein product [Rotaria socialis]CAF4704800.1 unnamed protein product [Rotaria socialis]